MVSVLKSEATYTRPDYSLLLVKRLPQVEKAHANLA